MEEKDAKTVWHCPYWRVETRKFRSGDGEEHIWYSAKRPNPETVHILGLTNDGLVPVIRQWRYPLEAPVWELPAGLCDIEGEAMTQTALRELEEERGRLADTLRKLGDMHKNELQRHTQRADRLEGESDERYESLLKQRTQMRVLRERITGMLKLAEDLTATAANQRQPLMEALRKLADVPPDTN